MQPLDRWLRSRDDAVMLIYKILSRALWDETRKKTHFEGAEIDLTDGYIHFSTAEQAPETAAKHFAGQDDLVIFAVDTNSLRDDAFKWEPSRGGALFPHLYRPLPARDIVWCKPLSLGPDGHVFPDEML
jgi:uncharacterized protein (DUF952 family)